MKTKNYRFQSGFRPGDSTILKLVYIVRKIYEDLEEDSEMRAVFLDTSKRLIEFGIGV